VQVWPAPLSGVRDAAVRGDHCLCWSPSAVVAVRCDHCLWWSLSLVVAVHGDRLPRWSASPVIDPSVTRAHGRERSRHPRNDRRRRAGTGLLRRPPSGVARKDLRARSGRPRAPVGGRAAGDAVAGSARRPGSALRSTPWAAPQPRACGDAERVRRVG